MRSVRRWCPPQGFTTPKSSRPTLGNSTARRSRAAQGEFVRWDTPIHGRAGGSETIIIDASVMPVKDEDGNVVFMACEGRDITKEKAQEAEIARKNVELHSLLEPTREPQFFANVSHELLTPLALIIGPSELLLDPDTARTREAQVRPRKSSRAMRACCASM